MAHLHQLNIRPQIYTDLLEGDQSNPYYLYIGASEDSIRRFTQHQQAYDAFKSGDNDGWSTPDFTRKHHRAMKTLQLQFVDGGQCCAAHNSEKAGIEEEDDEYAGPSSLQYDVFHDGGRGE